MARGRMNGKVCTMLLALLLFAAAPAAAGDDVSQAKVHFQAGKTFYELGQYSDAIREFAAGYALSPKPEFIINLAQAYRAAGQRTKALEMFERYLEKAPANAKPRAQVQQVIEDLKKEIAAEPPSGQTEPLTDAPVKPPPPVLEPSTTPVPPAAEVKSGPSPAVIIVPVVIGAAVIAGVITAVAVGVSNSLTCAGAPGTACVDLRPMH